MFAVKGRQLKVTTVASAILLPLAGALALSATTAEAAAADLPSVRLVGITDHLTWVKDRNREIHGVATTYVATRGGAWELWAQRADYRDPIVLSQTVRDSNGQVLTTQPLAGLTLDDMRGGLPDFTQAILRDDQGITILERSFDFCPNGYQLERVNDTGPESPTYPESCFASPFSIGAVWGLDKGWASRNMWGLSIKRHLPVGNYQLEIAIADLYKDAFEVADAEASVVMNVTILGRGSNTPATKSPTDVRGASSSEVERSSLTRAAGVVPGPEALPDLAALPAWGMNVENKRRSGKSYLNFGATVWNRGPSQLVVEGFREPNEESMKAYQYFYEDDVKVGRAFAGRLEYDHDAGHDHWHFRDFANYSLLAADKSHIVRSGKEAFCLAPTDMIDLTVPGASLRPWLTGLGTACGEPDSLWIREVLETGWGDTYAQYRPGQSFNITDLPNGKYFVEVRANPDERLYEVTDANNIAYRRIYLRGKAGERRVEVPLYHGIDTETGGSCGPFC